MKNGNLKSFITDLDKPTVDFWRETLTMLRQLHNDVWNGVRFFFSLNAIIFAGFAALLRGNAHTYHHLLILLILPAFGVALSYVGSKVLRSHRKYYLDMLTRKSIIEKELDFYDYELYKDDRYRFDLSFPWSVDQKYFNEEFSQNYPEWRKKQETRPQLISTWLANIYKVAIGIHIFLFLYVLALIPTCFFQ